MWCVCRDRSVFSWSRCPSTRDAFVCSRRRLSYRAQSTPDNAISIGFPTIPRFVVAACACCTHTRTHDSGNSPLLTLPRGRAPRLPLCARRRRHRRRWGRQGPRREWRPRSRRWRLRRRLTWPRHSGDWRTKSRQRWVGASGTDRCWERLERAMAWVEDSFFPLLCWWSTSSSIQFRAAWLILVDGVFPLDHSVPLQV